jgi:hypothetical protein
MSTKFCIGNLKELSLPLLLWFCTESLIYTLKDRKDTNLRYCLKFVQEFKQVTLLRTLCLFWFLINVEDVIWKTLQTQ